MSNSFPPIFVLCFHLVGFTSILSPLLFSCLSSVRFSEEPLYSSGQCLHLFFRASALYLLIGCCFMFIHFSTCFTQVCFSSFYNFLGWMVICHFSSLSTINFPPLLCLMIIFLRVLYFKQFQDLPFPKTFLG